MDRRLKALDTLRQIEKRALEDISRDLNLVQAAQHAAESRVRELQDRAAVEARSTEVEALPYVGRFLAALRAEQTRERAKASALDAQIAQLRDQVFERFTSEKTYDQLANQRRVDAQLAELRHDEAQLEDLSSARYLRQRQK